METSVNAFPPPLYTRAVQRSPGGAWLFPLAGEVDVEKEADKGKDGRAAAPGGGGAVGGGGGVGADPEAGGGWLVVTRSLGQRSANAFAIAP